MRLRDLKPDPADIRVGFGFGIVIGIIMYLSLLCDQNQTQQTVYNRRISGGYRGVGFWWRLYFKTMLRVKYLQNYGQRELGKDSVQEMLSIYKETQQLKILVLVKFSMESH